MLKRLFLALSLAGSASTALAAPQYALVKTIPLGAPDRWDYVVFDAATNRVYIAHGDRLAVLEADSGAVAGVVQPIPGGAHGIGISTGTGQGFTDDGREGSAIAFDLKTLAISHRIPAGKDADAIAVDRASGHIFIIQGDPMSITVIDPKTDAAIGTIAVGEKLEYAISDDRGAIYVSGAEKRDLIKIDASSNLVLSHWPAPDCAVPHGLAIDTVGRRLFMGCINGLVMVMGADDGRVIAKLPIGRGSDAVAFDPKRKRIFSSNGVDGTISVFQQLDADRYQALETIPTQISGRTMTVNPATGRLYVAAAQTDPSPTPGGRPRPRPGTLHVLIFDPLP